MLEDWVERYTAQVRALKTMGLSVGTPKEDIVTRYHQLLTELQHTTNDEARLNELMAAYDLLRSE